MLKAEKVTSLVLTEQSLKEQFLNLLGMQNKEFVIEYEINTHNGSYVLYDKYDSNTIEDLQQFEADFRNGKLGTHRNPIWITVLLNYFKYKGELGRDTKVFIHFYW